MGVKQVISIKTGLSITVAILAMFALVPYANASMMTIHLNSLPWATGSAPTGKVTLTYSPNPNASKSYDPVGDYPTDTGQPYAFDPNGSQSIIGASGTFNGKTITGVMDVKHSTPPSNELLPYSYSELGPTSSPTVSWDNLFYPNGHSPLNCLVAGSYTYPFAGGKFDIFGVALTLNKGSFVDLWSNGFTSANPNLTPPATYAYKVAAVPAPSFLWLFAAAIVLGLFVWDRRLRPEGEITAT